MRRDDDGTTDSTDEDGRRTIASVVRALDVLMHIAQSERPDVGVTEVARELRLSKAVVHRLLATLASRDLVQLHPETRRYQLGPSALTLGNAYLDRIELLQLVQPYLRELSDRSGETATLSIRNGWSRVYVAQVTPEREVRMEVAIGRPFPLHAGSSSKAFLAHLPPDERERYLSSAPLERLTDRTLIGPDALRDQLEQIRLTGYARSLGERQAGAASIAAPILDHAGVPAGVMSVCGPIERFGPHVADIKDALLSATGALSRSLGFRGQR